MNIQSIAKRLLGWGLKWGFVALSLYCIGLLAITAFYDWLPKKERQIQRHLGIELSTQNLLPEFLKQQHPRLRELQNRSPDWPALERRPLQAFVNRHSITPGEPLLLHVARHPELAELSGHFEVWRLGSKRQKVAESPKQKIPEGQLFADSAAVGFSWPHSPWQPETGEWSSGFYQFDFVAEGGKQYRDVAFVVVTNPEFSGDILLKLSTNTWAAYNTTGGHSLYKSNTFGKGDYGRGQMVSFDRPLKVRDFHSVRTWAGGYIRWLEGVAEKNSWQVDYATNFDLHQEPRFSRDYPLLISVGHDEYWSLEEYQAMWERLYTHGKSALVLSANSAYWQVRYSDINASGEDGFRGRQMICFKSTNDLIQYRSPEPLKLLSARYREENRLPENQLLGVAFDSFTTTGFVGDFSVHSTDFAFFEGTGLEVGDSIQRIVGHEWDNRDPVDSNWDQSNTPLMQRPEGVEPQVVFRADMQKPGGAPSVAEAVYFETPAGAKVFNAGVNHWVWGLGRRTDAEGDPRFQRLNENIVRHLLSP